MIAKAAPISHGANAIRYSVDKDRADIVKTNLMPMNISPDAMYQRMMLHCKAHMPKIQRGSPMKEFVIRIELSPSAEETKGWTLDDWRKLSDEFIRTFDSIDLSKETKRKSAKRTKMATRITVTWQVSELRWLRISSTSVEVGTVGGNQQAAQKGNLRPLFGCPKRHEPIQLG